MLARRTVSRSVGARGAPGWRDVELEDEDRQVADHAVGSSPRARLTANSPSAETRLLLHIDARVRWHVGGGRGTVGRRGASGQVAPTAPDGPSPRRLPVWRAHGPGAFLVQTWSASVHETPPAPAAGNGVLTSRDTEMCRPPALWIAKRDRTARATAVSTGRAAWMPAQALRREADGERREGEGAGDSASTCRSPPA